MIYTVEDNKNYGLGKRENESYFLNIFKVAERRLEKGSVFRLKAAANKTLLLVTSGSMAIGERSLKKGSIICIFKHGNYEFFAAESAGFIEISFEYSNENLPLFRESIRVFEAPLEAVEYIDRIYYNRFYISTLTGVNEALMLNVLNMLNVLCDSYSAELGLYRNFCEWLASSDCITAEQAATAMGCTTSHLNRTVKKYSNKCLSTVISEKMILEIKRLIKYSNCTTKEIAYKLGFDSPELMRKFFKYHTGMSVRDYKKSIYD